MRILVSSKVFASTLKRIDLDSISSVKLDKDNYLTINFGRAESITFPVESKSRPEVIYQGNARWDWFYNDLKRISEKPIIVEFSDNKIRLPLEY